MARRQRRGLARRAGFRVRLGLLDDRPRLDSRHAVWPLRSPLWREAFAYIVVDGPIDESRNMLLRAVRDSDDSVAQQAAISLCHQYVEYPDDRIPVDAETVVVIRRLISRLGDDNMEPVPEFLAAIA